MKRNAWTIGAAFLLGLAFGVSGRDLVAQTTPPRPAPPPARPAAASRPAERTVWYFYRVQWGAQDEFLDLFQKNHYPVLKTELQEGRLTAIKAYVPAFHGDGRADWTFATALTFRDAAALMTPDDGRIALKLFPDQPTFLDEEQRRFELLDSHWDVPLNEIDFETRKPTRPRS